MLLSASVNSISSIPSPVYQCKKAFLRNMAVNCSLTRRNISWMEVEFPMKVAAIFSPVGGIINELRPLGIMTLGPVVPGPGLPEDEVIRSEDLTVRPRSDAVHGPWLQVHQHRPGNVAAAALALVATCGVDPVLVADHLPELGSDLVPTLTTLDVEDLPHLRDGGCVLDDLTRLR
ncbi:unnamed protein product [Spirodela intermedia]|uniref:Uncharacterized protein n=1 Tax=Spirodela intermedia TaxID=51605 RepID=A0A7I8L0U7_SPIIN|nr:unnamed protein product [Spirodela intermedia]